MKKLAVSVLTIVLTCSCLFGLIACNGKANDNTFIVGKEVRSSLQLPWTMLIYANSIDNIFDYDVDANTATITDYVLIANRKADMGKKEDYCSSSYYRYIYDAKIVGKVDSKFADRVLWVGCRYNVDIGTRNKFASPSNGTEVATDGTFVYEFYVYSNEPVTDFTPAQVTIGSYVTYYLTYKNTYDMEYELPYRLPNSYTKKSDTIMLPSLGDRIEYEKVNGENKQVTYVFDGWYNGDTLVTQIQQGSTGDLELTAHWKMVD